MKIMINRKLILLQLSIILKPDKIIFNQSLEISKVHKNLILKEIILLKIKRISVFFHSISKIILMNSLILKEELKNLRFKIIIMKFKNKKMFKESYLSRRSYQTNIGILITLQLIGQWLRLQNLWFKNKVKII